jgi:hypothetical protein
MYLPYITWKYKELEKIISFDAMRHFALRGSNLLLVQLHDDDIFGGIYEIEKDKIITQYAGIKQGKFDHLQQGIITLSYYFLISIAQSHHIKTIDFGTSPPFLHDGLNRYKRGWRMQIVKTKPVFSTIFAIKINNSKESILSFFQKNPFFYYKNQTISLAYQISQHEDKTRKKHEIIKQNHLKGIEPTPYYSIDELSKP